MSATAITKNQFEVSYPVVDVSGYILNIEVSPNTVLFVPKEGKEGTGWFDFDDTTKRVLDSEYIH